MVLAHQRVAFQTAMRRAAVEFLQAQSSTLGVRMQIYPARPRTLVPPTGFVDLLRERIDYTGLNQRSPQADVIVVYGLFDSLEAVTQRDMFVDGLINYSFDHIHQADPNTEVVIRELVDIPDYVPEWIAPSEQRTYYASRIVLEGLALTG